MHIALVKRISLAERMDREKCIFAQDSLTRHVVRIAHYFVIIINIMSEAVDLQLY